MNYEYEQMIRCIVRNFLEDYLDEDIYNIDGLFSKSLDHILSIYDFEAFTEEVEHKIKNNLLVEYYIEP